MNGRPLILLLFLTGCSSPGFSDSQTTSPPAAERSADPSKPNALRPSVAIPIDDGELLFRVELAVTPNERARGLMYREKLGADDGMLFLFDRTQRQSFWMKNTLIPLDMIFIDARGTIVGIVENAEPLTTESRSVNAPSKYVLELNGGTCRKLGIREGALVRFIDIPGHPRPD